MDFSKTTVVKPGLIGDNNAYWAMHFCSIIETLYDNNRMKVRFNSPLMGKHTPTMRNLVSLAGEGYFSLIKDQFRNFGLQNLLCHYLMSYEGREVLNTILINLSDYRNVDILANMSQFGVFISCRDFRSGTNFAVEHNPYLLGHENVFYNSVYNSLKFADLCILFRMRTNPNQESATLFGILGEVEGNNGQDLKRPAFWGRKGLYLSFGIGVNPKPKGEKRSNQFQLNDCTCQWVNAADGYKFVAIFESEHHLVTDYLDAIGTIEHLNKFGPNHPFLTHYPARHILNIVRDGWDKSVDILITELRRYLAPNELASLRTNPVIPFIPSFKH